MPYSKEYNEEKYAEIERYLTQLEKLEEGKVLSISLPSVEEAERVRWLFYDYFHLAHVSKSFKLALFNNLLLLGTKKLTLSTVTNVEEKRGVTKQLDNIVKELLILPFPRRRVAELVLDEKMSLTALSIVLGEVGRALGE